MSVFLERLSRRNMLNCAEQVQIQKFKTRACKTPKTVGVQTIMLKHPTKQQKKKKKKTTQKTKKQKNKKKPHTQKTKQNKRKKKKVPTKTQIPHQRTHK